MKKCLFCGKEFIPATANQLYCSRKCAKSVKTKCGHCGKEIIRYGKEDGVYFCTRQCAELYFGRTVQVKCEICGKRFVTKKSNLESGWGRYCSKECQHKSLKVKHFKTCPQCGKVFEWKKRSTLEQKYCSKECMKEAFRKPIDENLLRKLYVEDELTAREVGEVLNRSKKVVLDYLRFYNITVRPDGIRNRNRIRCNDGHLVRSYYERAFDNLLHRNGIAHEYDPRLPFNKRYMADFKVGDVYIEIWGLMSFKHYRERREKKIQMYHENNCKLLEIFPDDFKCIQNKLDELKSLMHA